MPSFRILAWGGLLIVAGHALHGETVQFAIQVQDEGGQPLPARVLVQNGVGQCRLPPTAATVNLGPETWFACPSRTRLDLPAGIYRVRIERGTEYRPIEAQVDASRSVSRVFQLHRWIDMAARGYRSGENHLHVPASQVPALLAAEGLDFGSSLSWWNGAYFPTPAHAVDSAGTVTLFDSEVENDWGAVYSIGASQPMPIAWDPARANLPFAAAARAAGALNCYQGGWSREVLVDALLGYVDVVNLGDNLFHLHKFMPRARYSNLLHVAGLPDYPATDEGMLRLAVESYYRLLNCGLRLAAGAGTAAGVKSNAPGYNRAYVKLRAAGNVRDFLEGWRSGHNFVTNGPMLFLRVDGGAEPGDTVALPKDGRAVPVHVEAISDQPLRSLTLIVNGRTVASSPTGTLDATVEIHEGAWIAAMATAEDKSISEEHLSAFRDESALGGERPTRLRFAHTSPVYVTVGGKSAHVPSALAEANRLLDAFAVFAAATAAPTNRDEISRAILAARARLR